MVGVLLISFLFVHLIFFVFLIRDIFSLHDLSGWIIEVVSGKLVCRKMGF